jgi:hypothetical protein
VRKRPDYYVPSVWRWICRDGVDEGFVRQCGCIVRIDVALFQSFHNMFVVDVALFQSFHNLVVMAYFPPALGLTLLTWTKSEWGGYVLTYCFLTLQAMQMWSAIRRFRWVHFILHPFILTSFPLSPLFYLQVIKNL